jgi:hypothetical protein
VKEKEKKEKGETATYDALERDEKRKRELKEKEKAALSRVQTFGHLSSGHINSEGLTHRQRRTT